jgi:hypothetical protein
MVNLPTITVDASGVQVGTAKKLENNETDYAVYTYTGARYALAGVDLPEDAETEVHVTEIVQVGLTVKKNVIIYDAEGNLKGATGDSYRKIPY